MDPRPPTAGGHAAEGDSVESLRRKVKHAEANQRDWQETTQKEVRRQKMELESLKKENEGLKQQLNELRASELTTSLAGRSASTNKGAKKSKELDAKRDTLAHLEARLAAEQEKVHDMDRRIDETRDSARAARASRKHLGGVNMTKESHETINRQVTVLENRLDQSLVRFNDVLRQNKELRDEIDTLRGERDVFEGIYQKLEAELQEKKKEMAFIIEVSNIAYEEKDNNEQVLKNLKLFAAEELNSFAETFKELDELLEEDRRMKEQVKVRIAALEKREAQKADEDKAKSAFKALAGATAKDSERDTTSVTAQAAAYEEAFMKIRQATDMPDLNQLVQRFLLAEEENFSLFSYVNDLGKEIEALEKQRSEILDEIEVIAAGNEVDQSRRKQLKALEDNLRGEEHKNQNFIDGTVKAENVLRGIMTNVESLFTRLDCDEAMILEQHGVSGLTLDNLVLHLGSIELRSDEYLNTWAQQQGVLVDTAPRGPQVPFDSTQVVVDIKRLPGTGEDADGSDDDDHPLSREELLRKVQKKMNAQAVAAAQRHTIVKGPKGNRATALKK